MDRCAEEIEENPHHYGGCQQGEQHGRCAFAEPESGGNLHAWIAGVLCQTLRQGDDEYIGSRSQVGAVASHANADCQ